MSIYNEFVQDHYRHPRHLGRLEDATVSARRLREDAMLEFHLRVDGDAIEAASFRAVGCAGTVAAGSFLAEWLTGRGLDEARRMDSATLLGLLGGLPPERLYCADFATETLAATLVALEG